VQFTLGKENSIKNELGRQIREHQGEHQKVVGKNNKYVKC
jgi:hypothetical protein